MAAQKVDGTCTFVARGYRISFVSRCLWVSQDVRIAGRIADENVKRMIQMLCYAYMPSAMSHPHSYKYIGSATLSVGSRRPCCRECQTSSSA